MLQRSGRFFGAFQMGIMGNKKGVVFQRHTKEKEISKGDFLLLLGIQRVAQRIGKPFQRVIVGLAVFVRALVFGCFDWATLKQQPAKWGEFAEIPFPELAFVNHVGNIADFLFVALCIAQQAFQLLNENVES